MKTWSDRVADRFLPTVPSLADWAAAYPVELADLIDAARGCPRRTVEQRYEQYAARAVDVDQVSAQARLVADQVRRNAALRSVLAAEQARPEPVVPEPEPVVPEPVPVPEPPVVARPRPGLATVHRLPNRIDYTIGDDDG